MLTTMLTSAVGTKMAHASQAPMSARTMSSMPAAARQDADARRRVEREITIGTTTSATHSRSKPNHAPASSRVATAPAPIIPAAVSAAGPTSRRTADERQRRGERWRR